MLYYLDIETYSKNSPDPKTDKIITIQYIPLSFKGEIKGPLTILREWELGEKEMIKQFYRTITGQSIWSFIPIGYNLSFEWKFLNSKFRKYLSKEIDFLSKPQIDLKHVALLMHGRFKGCKLSKFTSKKEDGQVIADYYKNKEYKKIEKYIINETEAFCEFYKKLQRLRWMKHLILL